jgi:hypothetical protein
MLYGAPDVGALGAFVATGEKQERLQARYRSSDACERAAGALLGANGF